MTIRVVCAGDSNTRGRYGVSYVRMLAQRLRGDGVAVTGSGINGEVSYGLLQRLDALVRLNPSVLTIMIGTNDVWGTLSAENARNLITRNGLPYPPSAHHFRDHLESIMTRLWATTDARIGLMSPPLLGQKLDSPATLAGQQFAEIVEETARVHGARYLPVFERQVEYLRGADAVPVLLPSGLAERYSSVLQHYLAGRSFDQIGARRGLVLTADHVHQNTRGATMIADLVEQFVRTCGTDVTTHGDVTVPDDVTGEAGCR